MIRSGCAIAAGVALFACASVHAACGTSFCAVNTDWAVQGEWTKRGGRVDLRFEYIDQDQPRAGTDKVAVGEVPAHHDEVRTINRNWIATFDYNFSEKWGVSAVLPVVDRSHEHIHNHQGAQLPESWNFTEVGDARVTGRYRFASWAGGLGAAGLNFGVKLPTGSFDVTNDDGDAAERSLQPGTATTDGWSGCSTAAAVPQGRHGLRSCGWRPRSTSATSIVPGTAYSPIWAGALAYGVRWPTRFNSTAWCATATRATRPSPTTLAASSSTSVPV